MRRSPLASSELVHTAKEPVEVLEAPILVSAVERADRTAIDVSGIFPESATRRVLLAAVAVESVNPFIGLDADAALALPGVVSVEVAGDGIGAVPVIAHDADQFITAFYEVE